MKIRPQAHFKVLLGFKWKCIGIQLECVGVQLRVHQGSLSNPDALSNKPGHTLNWTPKHFEMSLGPYSKNLKKKIKR